LQQAGIPAVHWLPSFPETGREAVTVLQARHLAQFGLRSELEAFRLSLPENFGPDQVEGIGGQCPSCVSAGAQCAPYLAVAPGSGQAAKNWPLAHYYEVSRTLAWEYKLGVVWLAGPAEASQLPYLQGLAAAQGHLLLAGANLARVAAVLSRCRLFLGNDSGLTHLAAAVGGPEVVALFGPTDPLIWAPMGSRVRILTGPCAQAPCARGRRIPCDTPRCLEDLSPERVLAAAAAALA
jgi:ADP-heptose:LPS heptosyltransferase